MPFENWWDFIVDGRSGLTEYDVAFICRILWHTWKPRNENVFQFTSPRPESVLALAKASHS